jgi:hypothetical protein
MTRQQSHAALRVAFPELAITRTFIDEPSSRWANYEDADTMLRRLEGCTWTELTPSFVEDYPDAMRTAGAQTFCALLPAYLAYLLEFERFNEVPFHVARQLTHHGETTDREIFEERVALLTPVQRRVVASILSELATHPVMGDAISATLATWKSLQPSSSNGE